ncbi:MAG: hypothetical protein ACI3XM_08520, partial [Eubacteriales bacterium]
MSRKHTGFFSRPGSIKHFLQKLWGLLSLLGLTLVLNQEPHPDPVRTGLVFILFYCAAVWLTGLICRFSSYKFTAVPDETETPMLRSLTLDFISRIYMPVVICDEDGKIIWYNKALAQLFHAGEVLYGRYIDQYCTASIQDILSAEAFDGFPVAILPQNASHTYFHNRTTYDEEAEKLPRDWSVKSYSLSAENKKYHLLIWNDKHALRELQEQMASSEAIVGYILIDNLDEVLQFVQEQYRIASAQVESILNKW